MKQAKQILERIFDALKKMFDLPPLLTVLAAVPSFLLLIYVFAAKTEGTIASIAYCFSTYSMTLTVICILRISRKAMERSLWIQTILGGAFGQRFLKDLLSRTELSLYLGLSLNLLYAAMQMVSGIWTHSLWAGTLAAYYSMLALMRFLLLKHVNRNPAGRVNRSELKKYRLCGIILLLMTPVLAGIFIFVIHRDASFGYPGFLIYIVAIYAFYAICAAVRNVIKFRKIGSPVLSAAKIISLTKAMVSMLALETAMLERFDSSGDPGLRQVMTGTTGGAVCVLVLIMALSMIIRAAKGLKKMAAKGGNCCE